MWPFSRKRLEKKSRHFGAPCPNCGSTNTRLILYHGTDSPDYVRIWRGQRSLTYRCSDCGLNFYGDQPEERIADELIQEAEDRAIDDEEALQAAEKEIKRQAEEDDDRRCL